MPPTPSRRQPNESPSGPGQPTTTSLKLSPIQKEQIHHSAGLDPIEELQKLLDEFKDLYNTQRPHRALAGKTPHEAYTSLNKATPGDVEQDEWRTRHDIVDKAGRVCIRYAGRQYHLGIGRAYQGKAVTMVIVDKHVTTALKETGEVLTEHVINEARDYQKPIWKK